MRRSTAVAALVVAVAAAPLASAGTTAPASVDHIVHLTVDASPVLGRQIVAVPGYLAQAAPPAQVRQQTAALVRQERAPGSPVFTAVTYRTVAVDGHRSARGPAGGAVGLFALRLFAAPPALGAGAQVAARAVSPPLRLAGSFTCSGVQVYEYVRRAGVPDRYTVTWVQGLTLAAITGADPAALRAWTRAYLAAALG
jgi:hypothetical protein